MGRLDEDGASRGHQTLSVPGQDFQKLLSVPVAGDAAGGKALLFSVVLLYLVMPYSADISNI